MNAASIRSLNPLRLFSTGPGSFAYEKLPGNFDIAPNGVPNKGRFPTAYAFTQRFRWNKVSLRIAACAVTLVLFIGFLGGGHYSGQPESRTEIDQSAEEHANTRYWEVFARCVSPLMIPL